MIRVGLARVEASYGDVRPPFPPDRSHPELASLGASAPEDEGAARAANPAFEAVRAALFGLGLDQDRFGTPEWNPLGELVARGAHVVLKPNFIRHFHPTRPGDVACVITHGALVRAAADYAWLAVGREGRVTLAEAPQMDCDWERIREIAGLDALTRHYHERGLQLDVIDLRRECTRFEDGVVVWRRPLPGDPRGCRVVELGAQSFFEGSGLDPSRMRGADYDPGPTEEHHTGGHNEYLLSETVLCADLVVNLPKIKTHKKTGVTLSTKNLVGINGDKNWLPHHCLGGPREGGDEFPDGSPLDRLRSRATEWARPWLSRGRGTGLFRLARRAEKAARGDDFIRAGNWQGNRTTWRMCLDLNRAFYYSDAKGVHLDAEAPVRRALHLLDGIIAGEGEGPLAPTPRPLGAVIAATDPVAADLVAVRLMGFDEERLPVVREAMRARTLPITAVRKASDVSVVEVRSVTTLTSLTSGEYAETFESREVDLDGLVAEGPVAEGPVAEGPVAEGPVAEGPFVPHTGWPDLVETGPRSGTASKRSRQ